MFGIDDAMADVVTRSTQPALAAIKLAWWRERLEELDEGKVPAEPKLQAVARELLPRGITGAELAELEAGWAVLLEEKPDTETALGRGAKLFQLAGRLIHPSPPNVLEIGGFLYAAAGLHRRGLTPAGLMVVTESPTVARRYRGLTAIAALARRDLRLGGPPFEPEATPGRAWTLLRHRLTGRY